MIFYNYFNGLQFVNHIRAVAAAALLGLPRQYLPLPWSLRHTLAAHFPAARRATANRPFP